MGDWKSGHGGFVGGGGVRGGVGNGSSRGQQVAAAVALAVADFSGGTCGATEEDQGNIGVWWHLVVTDGGGDLGGQDGMENATQKLLDVGVNKRYGYNRQFCLRKYVCTTPVASIKCEGHKN
jgi:hypothetical protein